MLIINGLSIRHILQHITSDYIPSRISFFFMNVINYIIQLTIHHPKKDSIYKLNDILQELIRISQVIFLLFVTIIILVFIFFYVSNINSLCHQIFTLKNVFKIFEVNE